MRVLTVQEVTKHIKSLIEQDYLLANAWVKGEISNFKAASSGHFYFTLKDECSSLKVVMFRSRGRSVLFKPENGMAVIVRGYISVFERDGSYQLYAEEMEPDGVGALHLAFEQLKERLQQEGLFDQKHKKPLPLLPRRIGIVTSPTGAVIRDMSEIIKRRWPGREIILIPVQVQGETAPPAIARGIQVLNRLGDIDLIIVGRGGGSIEELWAFNTEIVARSIYNSRIPVISAVGHETDITISDFVADARAATPSAAAEMAVPDKREIERFLKTLRTRLIRALDKVAGEYRRRLENCLSNRIFVRPVDSLCGSKQQTIDFLRHQLLQETRGALERQKGRLAVLAGRLQSLSPLATLARGYSICTNEDGSFVLSDARCINSGDKINVRLYRGTIKCIVVGKEQFNSI